MKNFLNAWKFLFATLSLVLVATLLKVVSRLIVMRIFDLNMSGAEVLKGQNNPIVNFVRWKTIVNCSNVITLQEVCQSQYEAIHAALGSKWSGSFKSFGPIFGCTPDTHGLAIFTRGQHEDVHAWKLPPESNSEGQSWWGLMKVHYRGLDIFNTHIRSHNRETQTPLVVEVVKASPLAVLAGDFNASPEEPDIVKRYEKWFEVDFDREYTYVQKNGEHRKIDYIWVTRKPIYIWGDAQNSPSNHPLLRGVIILNRELTLST
jgi:endonuclease/exonuclease/phosphatase family metal-dependent hydrolase